MWQPDERLRMHDQTYERISVPMHDPLEEAKQRSLGRIVVAIVVTLVSLAIVAVTQ